MKVMGSMDVKKVFIIVEGWADSKREMEMEDSSNGGLLKTEFSEVQRIHLQRHVYVPY